MSFIRYKTKGQSRYAYEITNYWDSSLKKVRQKTKYLGLVDGNNKFIKKEKYRPDKLILDFGDGYLLHQLIETTTLYQPLKNSFKDHFTQILPLIFYRLCRSGALSYMHPWIEGNILSCLYKNKPFKSHENSRLLALLGDEGLQQSFFKSYLSNLHKPLNGVVIDSTALPNEIHSGFNSWGYANGSVEKQMRFLCVIDQETSMPLFFRCLSGNIVDVSTLKITLKELEKLGVVNSFMLMDAGYFSEENINELFKNKIQFLTRLPAGRKIYKSLIDEEYHLLEKKEHAVHSGKRGLFIKEKEISLYGHTAYAYLILDPERKGKMVSQLITEKIEESKDDLDFTGVGAFILISSFKIDREKVVSHYYIRCVFRSKSHTDSGSSRTLIPALSEH